jgi:putative transposase
MSRRGNYHDNAVAESFFTTFKKRVTRRKTYTTREEAQTEIFNFIEMFYNPVKRHSHNGGLFPLNTKMLFFRGSKVSSKIWKIQFGLLI